MKDSADVNISVSALLSKADEIQAERYVASIILVVFCMVVGIIGNIVVCLVYWRKARKSNTHIFILHLAIYDLCVCVVVLPFMLFVLLKTFTFSLTVICKICFFFEYIFTGASSVILITIALDRYNKVCRPLQPGISARIAQRMFVGTLLASAALSSLTPILYGNHSVNYVHYTGGPPHLTNHTVPTLNASDDVGPVGNFSRDELVILTGQTCGIQDTYKGTTLHMVHIYGYFASFLFLYFSMTVLYGLVGVRLRKRDIVVRGLGAHGHIRSVTFDDQGQSFQSSDTCPQPTNSNLHGTGTISVISKRNVENLGSVVKGTNRVSPSGMTNVAHMMKIWKESQRKKRRKKGSKNAVMLFLVSMVFLLSWIPFWIIALKETLIGSVPEDASEEIELPDSGVSRFFRSLFLVNHAINPIIYSVVSEGFRTECRLRARRLWARTRP